MHIVPDHSSADLPWHEPDDEAARLREVAIQELIALKYGPQTAANIVDRLNGRPWRVSCSWDGGWPSLADFTTEAEAQARAKRLQDRARLVGVVAVVTVKNRTTP